MEIKFHDSFFKESIDFSKVKNISSEEIYDLSPDKSIDSYKKFFEAIGMDFGVVLNEVNEYDGDKKKYIYDLFFEKIPKKSQIENLKKLKSDFEINNKVMSILKPEKHNSREFENYLFDNLKKEMKQDWEFERLSRIQKIKEKILTEKDENNKKDDSMQNSSKSELDNFEDSNFEFNESDFDVSELDLDNINFDTNLDIDVNFAEDDMNFGDSDLNFSNQNLLDDQNLKINNFDDNLESSNKNTNSSNNKKPKKIRIIVDKKSKLSSKEKDLEINKLKQKIFFYKKQNQYLKLLNSKNNNKVNSSKSSNLNSQNFNKTKLVSENNQKSSETFVSNNFVNSNKEVKLPEYKLSEILEMSKKELKEVASNLKILDYENLGKTELLRKIKIKLNKMKKKYSDEDLELIVKQKVEEELNRIEQDKLINETNLEMNLENDSFANFDDSFMNEFDAQGDDPFGDVDLDFSNDSFGNNNEDPFSRLNNNLEDSFLNDNKEENFNLKNEFSDLEISLEDSFSTKKPDETTIKTSKPKKVIKKKKVVKRK